MRGMTPTHDSGAGVSAPALSKVKSGKKKKLAEEIKRTDRMRQSGPLRLARSYYCRSVDEDQIFGVSEAKEVLQ